jgi:hypothetical protein
MESLLAAFDPSAHHITATTAITVSVSFLMCFRKEIKNLHSPVKFAGFVLPLGIRLG